MEKIRLSEVKDLVEYEKVRESVKAAHIVLTGNRRVSVGENLTLLFENRETVLFQIEEMVRTERIVDLAKIQDEVDAYNELIPEPGQLSATLFIEIPDIIRMSPDEVRRAVNRFQGLERGCVRIEAGEGSVPAVFEGGHSKEEKMAAVQYVRFSLPPEARAALADHGKRARLIVDHTNYRAERDIPAEVRAEMLKDLAG